MYKVLEFFADLQDGNHEYQPNDEYPRAGFKVSKERLAELSGENNRRGVPLIKQMPAEKKQSKKKEK